MRQFRNSSMRLGCNADPVYNSPLSYLPEFVHFLALKTARTFAVILSDLTIP